MIGLVNRKGDPGSVFAATRNFAGSLADLRFVLIIY
jgi:hypothetical protein